MRVKILRAQLEKMRKPHPDQRRIDAESVALLRATTKIWVPRKRTARRTRLGFPTSA
jgi:hypothetical protein